MASALFPVNVSKLSTTSPMRPGFFAGLLCDFVCAATDAQDALETFLALHDDDGTDNLSVGWMAFDAHVGDTACQVRAAMFHNIRQHTMQIPRHSVFWTHFRTTIRQLGLLIIHAKELCQKLTIQKKDLRKLGLRPAGESRQSMLQKLGWHDPVPKTAKSHAIDWATNDLECSLYNHQLYDENLRFQAWRQPNHASQGAHINSSGHDDKTTKEVGKCSSWDPTDLTQVIRLVIFSYSLSKYKAFCKKSNIVGAKLVPNLHLETGLALMADCYNTNNPAYPIWKQLNRISWDFVTMQNWLSELSCAWVKKMAIEQFGKSSVMSRLLEDTTRKWTKGLTSVPCYIGYLTIRQLWLQNSTPILLVVKNFCDSGIHTNYFLAQLQDPLEKPQTRTCTGAHKEIVWDVQRTSAEKLIASQNLEPHVLIYGNSLDGNIEDYMNVISGPVSRHEDLGCVYNEEHCKRFLETSQDAIGLSFMADHKHYAFPLGGDEEGREIEVVAEVMDDVAPGLSKSWRGHKGNALELGCSGSMKTFMWQHAVLETVGRAAVLLEESNGVLPISAPV